MLIVEHVTKEYPTPAGPLRVLEDLNFAIAPGQSVAIVGPSGSGKSTLLNILGALDRPTSGRVLLDSQDYSTLDELGLARLRNQQIGFLFQEHHLLPQCTVIENVLVPLLAFGRVRQADVAWAKELLGRVGLGDRLSHYPGELSGGERQRTALVRALILRPQLILADEPTGNLDAATARQIVDLLLELHRELRGILVVVTHSHMVAERMGRIWRLQNGKLSEEVCGKAVAHTG